MQLYLAAVSICDLCRYCVAVCRYCIDSKILCARARDLLSFDRSSMSGGSSMCAGPGVDMCRYVCRYCRCYITWGDSSSSVDNFVGISICL